MCARSRSVAQSEAEGVEHALAPPLEHRERRFGPVAALGPLDHAVHHEVCERAAEDGRAVAVRRVRLARRLGGGGPGSLQTVLDGGACCLAVLPVLFEFEQSLQFGRFGEVGDEGPESGRRVVGGVGIKEVGFGYPVGHVERDGADAVHVDVYLRSVGAERQPFTIQQYLCGVAESELQRIVVGDVDHRDVDTVGEFDRGVREVHWVAVQLGRRGAAERRAGQPVLQFELHPALAVLEALPGEQPFEILRSHCRAKAMRALRSAGVLGRRTDGVGGLERHALTRDRHCFARQGRTADKCSHGSSYARTRRQCGRRWPRRG